MKLTRTEELLIDGLIVFGLNNEEIKGMMLFLDTEERQNQMIEYMVKNRNATGQELLKEMKRIKKTKH